MKTKLLGLFVTLCLVSACGVSDHDAAADDLVVLEGDIIVGTRDEVAARLSHAVNPKQTWARWPKGKVPYVIAGTLPAPERVKEAIAHIEAHTNLRFIPRTTQAAYVLFRPWAQGYCRSWIGRTGAAQAIDLDVICNTRSVIHEIGHAVGLWHEHTRSDRDKYVRVHPENVMAGLASNMTKQLTYAQLIGPYDYKSVMHYRSWELSKNGQPTVTRLDGSTDLSNEIGLSAGDISTLKAMYPMLSP